MASFVDHIPLGKTALICIEFQNDFTTAGGKLHEAVKPVMDSTNMLANTAETIAFSRQKGAKIFHLPIKFSENYRELSTNSYGILGNVLAGKCFPSAEWGGQFSESVSPAPEDVIIEGKKGLCGFASTNLDFVLRQHGIEVIALTGFLTNCCVESTMRTAYEKGYKVITLTDCMAATSLEAQEAAIKFTFPMFSVSMTHSEFIEKISNVE